MKYNLRIGSRRSSYLGGVAGTSPWIVAFGLAMLGWVAGAAHAQTASATASAVGGNNSHHDGETGYLGASAEAGANGSYGAFGYASAEISGIETGAEQFYAPRLHAVAFGTSGGDSRDPHGEGGYGNASCTWTDDLRLDNPLVGELPPLFTIFAYFSFRLDGVLTGPAGVGSNATIGAVFDRIDGMGDHIIYEIHEYFDQPGLVGGDFALRVPIDEFNYDFNDVDGMPVYPKFTLGLSINAGSAYGPDDTWFGDGKAEFLHTLALESIYFGDADGNPVAGLENFHVVGNGGQYAMGVPVPEPGTVMLGLVGAALVGAGAGYRRWFAGNEERR